MSSIVSFAYIEELKFLSIFRGSLPTFHGSPHISGDDCLFPKQNKSARVVVHRFTQNRLDYCNVGQRGNGVTGVYKVVARPTQGIR